MAARGLTRYDMANDIAAWWFPLGTPKTGNSDTPTVAVRLVAAL